MNRRQFSNFECDLQVFLSDAQWDVIRSVRDPLMSWCGTFCEARFTLRSRSPISDLQTFLQNSYELDKKDLQSKNSVLQSVGRIWFATRKLEF